MIFISSKHASHLDVVLSVHLNSSFLRQATGTILKGSKNGCGNVDVVTLNRKETLVSVNKIRPVQFTGLQDTWSSWTKIVELVTLEQLF